MLLATLAREVFTSERFDRSPESDLSMDSGEAVTAFVRAGQPNSILSGVYAFYREQACKMIRPGDCVLDLGCGPALLLASIAALNEESRFLGIDSSDAMIAAGQAALAPSVDNLDLRTDDMTELSTVPTGSIDVVLSSMALHHLRDTVHLRRCFEAIERIMAPDARMFIADFGRLKSLKSVEYFVQRAIPPSEPRLEQDYRASLRAAFSRQEFERAMSNAMKQRVSVYATVATPMMIALMTAFPADAHACERKMMSILRELPPARRADYRELTVSLRLGGMPRK